MKNALTVLALTVTLTGCIQGGDPSASSDAPTNLGTAAAALSQPAGVTLVKDGVSTLGWPFLEGKSGSKWHVTTGSPYHGGCDAYADDWNYGSGNSDKGKTLLSATAGTVIFAGKGGEKGYGKQVVVQYGDFAVRYAHMDRVDVTVGDTVWHGTQIGTVGCTGLTCKAPQTAHLHLVLYKNIKAEATPGKTALSLLKTGENPTTLKGAANTFAAPFNVDSTVAAPFTVEDAASRLSPVMRTVSLPDNMVAGQTYTVDWTVMGYHGPMASSMTIRCTDNAGKDVYAAVTDNTPDNLGQGWHWQHASSRIYGFSRSFTLAQGLPNQECEVRFFWARQAYPGESAYTDYNGVFISVLIPGGVDAKPLGDAGRKLSRTIVHAPGSAAGTIDWTGSPDVDPTLEQAASRLSPVMRTIELGDNLKGGKSHSIAWETMGYHGPMSTKVYVICDGVWTESPAPTVEDLGTGMYSWGSAVSHRYRYETTLSTPDVSSKQDCMIRFFWSRDGYTDYNEDFISILIPGGVDDRPSGTAGRAILRTLK